MRVLVALGGNAMTSPDGQARPDDQIAAVAEAAEAIVRLIQAGHQVVITHGNGPQVGNLLVKNEMCADVVPPVPLDWCVGSTQATIGLILSNALDTVLHREGLATRPVTLVTRTLVDENDPAMLKPSKPIGRYLPQAEAESLIEHGQNWEDRGERGWRRVVPSPQPVGILEAESISTLLDAGQLVIAAGGGGIPVARGTDGRLHGVQAVIDKDTAAVVLAHGVDADALIIATDVENAAIGWGTEHARSVGPTTPSELDTLAAEGHFADGSMGPKVAAVSQFVKDGGRLAVITELHLIDRAVDGDIGTAVRPDPNRN
ncbi:carbamate kinase [Saxibacter everestensis]|uniref:Carbamate kinase n=1 Tax=Saxibacter everestensis TaxID=2909229 RepID=A0ABY8QU63_9MICO|nr:carbamate kinase [Brevibacteriaceae bacterium ZFBP1038]